MSARVLSDHLRWMRTGLLASSAFCCVHTKQHAVRAAARRARGGAWGARGRGRGGDARSARAAPRRPRRTGAAAVDDEARLEMRCRTTNTQIPTLPRSLRTTNLLLQFGRVQAKLLVLCALALQLCLRRICTQSGARRGQGGECRWVSQSGCRVVRGEGKAGHAAGSVDQWDRHVSALFPPASIGCALQADMRTTHARNAGNGKSVRPRWLSDARGLHPLLLTSAKSCVTTRLCVGHGCWHKTHFRTQVECGVSDASWL